MKGWREYRPELIKSDLQNASFPLEDPPEDLYDDIATIDAYLNGGVEVEVERINRSDDGRHKVQFILTVRCHVGIRTSSDGHGALCARFRIADTSSNSVVPWDRLAGQDPLSVQVVEISRTWLKTCNDNHQSCVAESPQLPARFLDIADDADFSHVFLKELRVFDHSTDSRYVALSHCWGTGQNLCTTRSTLQKHKHGIKVSELPPTFRDADDPHDWQIESAKMASIYRDAYFVLGAACGESDAQGFLHARHWQDVVTLTPLDTGTTLALQLLPTETDEDHVDPVSQEPLSKRAWCLQERYLPRRMLLYGSQRILWECQKMSASEEGDITLHDGSHLERICKTANIPASVLARACRGRYEGDKDVNYVDWYKMVEDYTGRFITKASDRLPALSGLWKNGLIEGLTWCGSQGAEKLEEPGEYISPSWSWASVAGTVRFPIYSWYERARWSANMSDFEPLAEYVSHSLDLLDLDQHGRLKGGWLRINAPLFPIISLEPRQSSPPSLVLYFGVAPMRSPFADKTIGVRLESTHETIEAWLEGGFDKPHDENVSLDQLFVVFLTRLPLILENGFMEHRFGLIVKKTGDGEQYRRVGFVDGLVLRKVYTRLKRWALKIAGDPDAEAYGVAGFRRPLQDGDMHNLDERPNRLAYDALWVHGTDITLV
ncbi:heterokaryon incompatibility protein (HET) domain-containing protein [Trichoderma breve]|uniref:Heterokaryon incompatibility protein (HET) domain-containing protein n=1 Tax=Trichoderma breve TaxID=2034170 RepID=A0A9W9B2Y1_9HYPO|nr:heterokaryon incompatibility protein (HET) domain-containing protein [Trichoderma breve]KAJ4854357.1 heterokaryon incompatibility protein (HET) domain-containing protein [Trichoderma breve]